MENEEELDATYMGRKLRIQILMEEIKKAKKMVISDIYKFALNRWMISSRIVDQYIKDIVATGQFELKTSKEGDYVEYVGGE